MTVVAATLNTITFRRTTYLVEKIKDSDAHLLPVRFVLHGPRGRRYLLVPASRRPDRLFAIAPITHFSRIAPHPSRACGSWSRILSARKQAYQ